MEPHHLQTVERLETHFRQDPEVLALIIGGSVAKGLARPDSDVDFMVVCSPEEYDRRRSTGKYNFLSRDFTDYEGGYVDGKYVDLRYLHDAAGKASEPTRWAFQNTRIAFSRIPHLVDLIARIAVYPEADRLEKMRSFYAQTMIQTFFIREAEKRSDRYLLQHGATTMALFGARLILAWNRMLFPYHKWLMRTVQQAPDKPASFMPLVDQLINDPDRASSEAFAECISSFRDWGLTREDVVNLFLADSEMRWRSGRPDLADW